MASLNVLSIVEEMQKAKIVPDVIDVSPSLELEVKYGNKEVNLGNTFTPTEVKNQPTSICWEYYDNKFYLLTLIDPDVPARRMPMLGEVNHWLIGNIKGINYSDAQIIFDYLPSGPPFGTGLHRYIFLVFEQPDKLELNSTAIISQGRRKFSIRKFAQKHNLGNPIAGNFFQAKWDSSVPNPIKQLTMTR